MVSLIWHAESFSALVTLLHVLMCVYYSTSCNSLLREASELESLRVSPRRPMHQDMEACESRSPGDATAPGFQLRCPDFAALLDLAPPPELPRNLHAGASTAVDLCVEVSCAGLMAYTEIVS